MALSSNGLVLAVGAPDRDEGFSNAGKVYVFELQSGSFQELDTLTDAAPAANDNFGSNVKASADGSVVAVGVAGKTVNSQGTAGHIVVFERSGSAWSAFATLEAPTPASGDVLGTVMAMSSTGDLIASQQGTNAVVLFTRSGASYTAATLSPATPPTQFGNAIAMNPTGTFVAVGAQEEDVGADAQAGKVFTF